MQEAAEKFRKYALNVERDLETLIFEMLDLIDSKTRTLRKLVKLHLHIKKVYSITTDKNLVQTSNRSVTPERKSYPVLTSVCNSFTDNISLTTSTQDLLEPIDSVCEETYVEGGGEIQDIDEIEKEIEAVGQGINQIELPEVQQEEKLLNQSQQRSLQNITKEIVEKLVTEIEESQPTYHDAQEQIGNETAANALPTEGSTDVEEIPLESPTPEIVTAVKAPSKPDLATLEEQHPNSPSNHIEGHSQISSRSSLHSYSILSNLERVLNNLQACQPGDCGFYLDPYTFVAIIDTLKMTIASYETSGCVRSPCSHMKHCMGKSSTQPILNVNLSIQNRKTSSNPECEKNAQRKKIRS